MDMMFPPPLSLARAPYVTSVSFRCHLPPILYRLYRDAPATASTALTTPSASLDTPDATPKRDDGLPKSPAFRASVKRRSLCAFTCLRSRPKRALAKAFEGDGLSQRTGLMSTMMIGAIEVRPARESENAMSWPEITVKAVSNSD